MIQRTIYALYESRCHGNYLAHLHVLYFSITIRTVQTNLPEGSKDSLRQEKAQDKAAEMDALRAKRWVPKNGSFQDQEVKRVSTRMFVKG